MYGRFGGPPPEFISGKSCNCWEIVEIKDTKRFPLTLFETMLLKLITVDKMLYSRTRNGAHWRYLKKIGSWSSAETFGSKDANWCIQTVFEMMFLDIGTTEKKIKYRTPNGAFRRNLNDVLVVGTAENLLKTRTLNGVFWHNLNRCFENAKKNTKSRRLNGALWCYLNVATCETEVTVLWELNH